MKANKFLETEGSITKKESLAPIEYKILENTFVAEAEDPYAYYYGKVPYNLSPNSLFLFTKQFCKLDELLKITCDMKKFFGYLKKLDVATSILDFTDHYHYALRIRDFPDYEHIHWLQTCYNSEGGVNFLKKVHISKQAIVTTFKRFQLEEIKEGIYLDKASDDKGYVILPGPLNSDQFLKTLIKLRNNSNCELFDAAIGTIEINSKQHNMIRIYSEKLNIGLLKCVQQRFSDSLLE